jgi:flagellum-specific peptidoglycan hydrolase FlgJ
MKTNPNYNTNNPETYVSKKKYLNIIVSVAVVFFLLGRISVNHKITIPNTSAANTSSIIASTSSNKPCRETFFIDQSKELLNKNKSLKDSLNSSRDMISKLELKSNELKLELETSKKNNSILMSLKNLKDNSPIINKELSFDIERDILNKVDKETTKKYIEDYYRLAMSEQDKFGFPASVKLAQGILESTSGQSTLTKKHKNHFGIKYYKRNYPSRIKQWDKLANWKDSPNYKDDDDNDHFVSFKGNWHSYRYHSMFVAGEGSPYLKKLPKDREPTYKDWCFALKRGGYATDPKYAYKLIKIIEDYNLHLLDK